MVVDIACNYCYKWKVISGKDKVAALITFISYRWFSDKPSYIFRVHVSGNGETIYVPGTGYTSI